MLAEGMKLVQYDYLGGNGSRGYGKVLFRDIEASVAVGTVPASVMSRCNQLLHQAVQIHEERRQTGDQA